MDPITLAAIMAGTGLLKSELIDRPKEERQRQLAATTQRYSPWTGLRAGEIQEADPFGNTLQGGLQGAAFGQSLQGNAQDKDLKQAQIDYLKRSGGFGNSLALAEQPAQNPRLSIGMGAGMYNKQFNSGY